MTKFLSLTLLSGFLCASALAEGTPVQVESTTLPQTHDRNYEDTTWGVGISYGLVRDVGLSVSGRLDSNWTIWLTADWNNNCCGQDAGGNPSPGIPYGWLGQASERDRLALIVDRGFALNSRGSWLIVAGAGLGFEETRSRVEFYNQTFIGFDLNSPAGSQSVYQKRWVVPARLGIRNTDRKIFGRPLVASAYFDFAVNGAAKSPTYSTPNGQPVTVDNSSYTDSAAKLELAMFF